MQATAARLQRRKRSARLDERADERENGHNGNGARRGVPAFLTRRLEPEAPAELTQTLGEEAELERPLEFDALPESPPRGLSRAARASRRVPEPELDRPLELDALPESSPRGLPRAARASRRVPEPGSVALLELEPPRPTLAPVTSRPPEPMPPAPPPRGTPAPPSKLDAQAKAPPAAKGAGDEAGAAKDQAAAAEPAAKEDKAASAQADGKGATGDSEGEDAPGDAPKPAAAAAAPGAGGRAATGTGRSSQDGEEEEASEETLPPEVAAQEEVPLEAPRLEWQPLTPTWLAPQSLPADALPFPKPASASATTPQPSAAPGKAQGAPTAPTKSPAGGSEQTRRDEREARERAQRAYLDLVRDARHEQEAFVGRANRICETMASAYDMRSREVLQGSERDLGAVDAAAAEAAGEVEQAASFAELTLESASRSASAAIAAAGRSAYGLINADDRTAAQRIGAVVSGLVSGHEAAYNSAISALTAASDAALLELNQWRDRRATNYSTEGTSYLEGAKNEKRQARIPAWVDPAATELADSVRTKTTEWGTTRDNTVCSLSCSYRGALETERVRTNTEGRTSVANALKNARKTLKNQTRDGRRALGDLRRSYLDQIRTRQRATRSGLFSQTRGTLAGLHQEARGGLSGVQGAANGAMASFERGPRGLEQSLRQSAPMGAAALRSAAERTPAGLLQTTQRESAQLDTRLQGNLSRLEISLAERVTTQERQSAEQLTALNLGLAELSGQATEMLDQSAAGLVEAFGGLAATVSQAASSWAQPLAVRMAGFIAGKQTEASAALTQVLTGEPPASTGPPAPAPAAGDAAAAPAPDCSHCAATPAGSGGEGTGAAGPKGLTAQADAEIEKANRHADPATLFEGRLDEAGSQVDQNLSNRAVNVSRKFEGAFAGTVDEEGAVAVLRGLTPVQGRALDLEVYGTVVGGGTLDAALHHYLDDDPDDYAAASAYLRGDAVEGARLELEASSHWYNDDEARIEATMRALSPDQLTALGRKHGDVVAEIRGVLDGTDQQVFNALAEGNYARADAYRMRDAVNSARRDGNADATHSAIEQFTGAPAEGDWRATQEMSGEDRRRAAVAELGLITSGADLSRESSANLSDARRAELEAAAVTYVTRDIQVYRGGAHGEAHMETLSITGANRDLAGALLLHGANSVEARAARLGVEMQRRGDPPNALNIDRATFDERFTPDNPNATPEERDANERQRVAARRDRARMLLLASQYAPADPNAPARAPVDHDAVMRPDFVPNKDQVAAAQSALIGGLRDRFGSDTLGGDLAAGLLSEERPSARTASLAMRHAMYSHSGTNEELLFRFTERMNRDEITAMRNQFRADTGRSLDAELGVYGQGSFGEVSGDDRLRMERALRGVARTDQERLEAAAYALHQQRQETGSFGAWLAEGTLAEQVMRNTERRIERLAGGPIRFSQRGELTTALPNFTAQGRFTGKDRDAFTSTTGIAQQVAENYSARIDAFADVATTGIAILGAIAAAVITVATMGAAGPLVVAAIATGLASMAANAAIKGGRYGWEQAGIDLGMTAVQALTAGIGAQLGAAAQVASKGAQAASQASRTLVALSRIFTGNPVVDQIIVGAITGSIGGLANTAFDERTWEHSGGDAVSTLFSGLLKGALSGAATATLTQSIEALGRHGAAISERARALVAKGGLGNRALGLAGLGIGAVGRGIHAAGEASTGGSFVRSAGSMAARGLRSGAIAGLSGMAGRSTEILYDAASGRYHGDAGDALMDIGQAGAHAFVQGIGEGAGEAVGQRRHNARLSAAAEAINQARAERGLPLLAGDPANLHEGTPLRAAAEDLMFLNQHGRNAGDAPTRARNLDQVAWHGGMTVVARSDPPAAEVDGMRAELMRHVNPDSHADFADVPIRVLPEAEYRALTRSESGPVVTLIQDGKPVVVVREGTPISRLADEGPHLRQTRDPSTRDRVARLDEATLSQWNHLDLDLQIELYRTKIELEIDAHQEILRSLENTTPTTPESLAHLTAEMDRTAGTLRNLNSRLNEVDNIGPAQRAAIQANPENRPQYLEQPARLFSKDSPAGRLGSTSEEIAAHIADTIGEIEGLITPAPHETADETPSPPHVPPEGHPEGDRDGRLFDRTREQIDEIAARRDRGNSFNTEQESRYPHNEVRLEVPEGGKGHPRVDSVVVGETIVERKHSQLAEIGEEAAIARINELAEIYHPGAKIADVPSNQAVLAEGRARFGADGDRLRGQPVLMVPEQHAPVPRAVLEHAERAGVIICDPSGRVYSVAHPDGNDGTPRVSARDPDEHLDAMRDALIRHVPAEHHEAMADVPIVVLPEAEYRALTRSDSGPVVTLIRDGQPIVVIRDGTPISRLSDEGPHLSQSREAHTRERVARLDETTQERWDTLDLDTQIDLYRNKIELEIDAHERIVRSLENEAALGAADPGRLAADHARAETTLRNLRGRLSEVEGLGPAERAAIHADPLKRPQYLDQPARLFSKDTAVPRPPPRTVFEPFSGPSVRSAQDLQSRYPGAKVITAEVSRPPTPADVAAFELSGGKFLSERFGESLPENSVDQMHVRFPLPHEKAQEMMIDTRDLARAIAMARAQEAGIESVTNLAPHALRALAPGGEIEIVFKERTIIREIERATTRTWTDPATGQSYRLEMTGPLTMAPKNTVAPHSGHAVGPVTDVHVVTLRKVPIVPEGTPAAGGERAPTHASVADAEQHATAMREELLRHVPAADREAFGKTPIVVLPEAEYFALTRSESGPVVTLIRNGEPVVVIREGTNIARLADEGPHLMQAREPGTRERVLRLDEAVVGDWHSLDLDTQIDLYRNKIELEIDAHERINRSLREEAARGEGDPARRAAEIERNDKTLRNLRTRLDEVGALGPGQRAAIESGEQVRPPYLDQPARLFSKDAKSSTTEVEQAPKAPPDPQELIRLREEEQGLQSERDKKQGMHDNAEREVNQDRETIRRSEEEREPLEAARRQQQAEVDELRQARKQLQEELDDFDLSERGLSVEERKHQRSEIARLKNEMAPLDFRLGELERSLRDLRELITPLDRRIADCQRRIGYAEPTIEKLSRRLGELDARLGEINARRSVVAGEWKAVFDRIGERPPCFVAGTLVHTPEGMRAIETLRSGDLVLAFDTQTGAKISRRVLRPEQGKTRRVLDITVAGELITATPGHRFWLPDRREWVEARALVAGTPLLDLHGARRCVEAVGARLAEVPTFNLLVDGEHNYFVGQGGFLVHNGKNIDELIDSIFRDELKTPPQPFLTRFYVIVHADDPDTIIYVGSTEKTLGVRLSRHVRERVYLRGPKAGTAWIDEAGGRVLITVSESGTEARSGPFIMREIAVRTCHSHFERFVWELFFIENIRTSAGATMQNDFTTPPVGRKKFNEFRDFYLAQLCAT